MGYGPEAVADMRRAKKLQQEREQLFEKRFKQFGLDEETIFSGSEQDLERVIDQIDELVTLHRRGMLTDKEILGTRQGLLLGGIEPSTMARAADDFLRALLERKELALERMRELKTNAQVKTLNKIAGNIPESPEKREIEAGLAGLQEQNAELSQRLEEVGRAREDASRRASIADMERYERKAKVWLTFLERESVASIIGAVLLLGLTTTVIVSAFTGTITPELLNNAFLIVIGYFFGQSTSRGGR